MEKDAQYGPKKKTLFLPCSSSLAFDFSLSLTLPPSLSLILDSRNET